MKETTQASRDRSNKNDCKTEPARPVDSSKGEERDIYLEIEGDEELESTWLQRRKSNVAEG
jgi:hypothetical protein